MDPALLCQNISLETTTSAHRSAQFGSLLFFCFFFFKFYFTTSKSNLSAKFGLYGLKHIPILERLVLLSPRVRILCTSRDVTVHSSVDLLIDSDTGVRDLSALPPEEIHPTLCPLQLKAGWSLGSKFSWYRRNIWGNSA